MDRHQQHVPLLAGAQQPHAQQRFAGQVEDVPGLRLDGAGDVTGRDVGGLEDARQLRLGQDVLVGDTVRRRVHRAQGLVPERRVDDRGPQCRAVHRARDLDGVLHVVRA